MDIKVSSKALHFIFAQETGGKDYYNRIALHPYWPKGSSGITLGAGWDCGQNSYEALVASWKEFVPEEKLAVLKPVMGLKGQKAANALTAGIINAITIPYDAAFKQFTKTAKQEVALTVHAFPKAEELNPDTIGVLTSIVYNRGTRMDDIDPKSQDRKEMRMIKMLVPQKDYKNIAFQIRSMKRLWDGVPEYAGEHEGKFSGLMERREEEAGIVDHSQREYPPDDILTFSIN